MDQIHLCDLQVRTVIGVHPEERTRPQDLLLNLTLYVDLRQAARSDALEPTVDYARVAERVVSSVEGSSFHLVEALAHALAELVLREFPVARVRVRVDKPGALARAHSAAVEVERGREDFSTGVHPLTETGS